MLLEICANSYESALNAKKGGADRIELCSELSVGGITPSYGLIEKVIEEIDIPIHVLIRPRSGDFCYSDEELDIMKKDIAYCKKLGVNGIVSGVLLSNNNIDQEKTKVLIELAKPMTFTFHRAFDCISNPMKAIELLIDLQVDRVLTSGKKHKALEGIELLNELHKVAKNQIIILPASGINATNIKIFKMAGFQEIHASASSKKRDTQTIFFDDTPQTISNLQKIKALVKSINEI